MHTNKTPHYELPQFIGSDIPNPLTDWNDSMQDIDTAMYEIKQQADEIGSDIVEDESDISDLQSQANLTDDNITLLNQQTTAARAAATDAQDAANRNASNITTLQQSVANNRTSITQYNNRFNQNVPFAFGIEEVEDPDNPGTMIEKYGYYTDDDPAEFVAFGEAAREDVYKIYSNPSLVGSGSGVSKVATITVDLSTLGIPLTDITVDNILVTLGYPGSYGTGTELSMAGGGSSTFSGQLWVEKTISNNVLTITLNWQFATSASGASTAATFTNVNVYLAKNIIDLTV